MVTGEQIRVGSFTPRLRPDGALDPDCVAIVLETAAGRVLHTGDWKLDQARPSTA